MIYCNLISVLNKYGVKAMELAMQGIFGKMVALKGNEVSYVSLEEYPSEFQLYCSISSLAESIDKIIESSVLVSIIISILIKL